MQADANCVYICVCVFYKRYMKSTVNAGSEKLRRDGRDILLGRDINRWFATALRGICTKIVGANLEDRLRNKVVLIRLEKERQR